jgi:hypothetical protein
MKSRRDDASAPTSVDADLEHLRYLRSSRGISKYGLEKIVPREHPVRCGSSHAQIVILICYFEPTRSAIVYAVPKFI